MRERGLSGLTDLLCGVRGGVQSLLQRRSGTETAVSESVEDVEGTERFRWITRNTLWFGLLVHAVFLAVFVALHVWSLVGLNVASVLAYVLALRLNGTGAFTVPAAIGGVEVTVHAVAATAVLGLRSGFFIYLPLLIVITFLHPTIGNRAKAAWAMVQAFVFMALMAAAETLQPQVALPAVAVRDLMVFNAFVFVASLAFLAHVTNEATTSAERDLRAALARLHELSRTDPLTGLLNRRAMSELLHAETERVARHGRPFALLIADLDDFKGINDAYGHPLGDHALRAVAQRLLGAIRVQDQVARWGGEEFLLLLPETDMATGLQVAERLRSAVAGAALVLDGVEHHATATFGVAVYELGSTIHDTIRAADHALYAGKERGKDRVVAGPPAA